MRMLEPCRICGEKDALVQTEKTIVNVFTGEISQRIKIECKRCVWSVEAVVTDADRARVIWNAANRKEFPNGWQAQDNRRIEKRRRDDT